MKKTNTLTVPTRGQLPRNNQQLFDSMSERLGWMPNMYAVMGQSESGLTKYLALENGKSSLRKRECEAVKLVVSKVNESNIA